jgi:hypothetical protein
MLLDFGDYELTVSSRGLLQLPALREPAEQMARLPVHRAAKRGLEFEKVKPSTVGATNRPFRRSLDAASLCAVIFTMNIFIYLALPAPVALFFAESFSVKNALEIRVFNFDFYLTDVRPSAGRLPPS